MARIPTDWTPAVRERLLERALTAAENGIVIADATVAGYPILFSNPSFAKLTGRPLEDPGADLQSTLGLLVCEHEDFQKCITDATDCNLVIEGKRCDAQEWCDLVLSPVRNRSGKVTHLIGILNDVTDRVTGDKEIRQAHDELEEKVRERTGELERINSDLEGFTYSVSHDLRAPLRAIIGFSNVLVQDYGREVDSEMKRTLDRINSAAARMSSIIEDLLSFSRLGRKEMIRQKVDLTQIAESVGTEIARSHPDQDTKLGVDEGMVVEGDPTLLRMALENLLDNAYKFTSKREHGSVEVRKLGEHRFVVRDNGAGFEPQYSDKLFRPFERLHSASEYPGTGIGLANVRRIIERHGGKVWAEGEPEKGASFYFEL